jgi:3-hydroxypropanoate dehydrogenase
MHTISPQDIETLFTGAHTHSVWLPKRVDDALLSRAYDLAKMCPTSANSSPMRVVFVKSKEAKEKLKPCLAAGNVDKSMTAPVTAIVGMDMEFYEHLPKLYPHVDARSWFAGNAAAIEATAFRNGSLQGAYFLLALRAVGLDTGAISGFDNAKVDAAFFAGTTFKSNFIINIGYGDARKLHPRNPRFKFEEACSIV